MHLHNEKKCQRERNSEQNHGKGEHPIIRSFSPYYVHSLYLYFIQEIILHCHKAEDMKESIGDLRVKIRYTHYIHIQWQLHVYIETTVTLMLFSACICTIMYLRFAFFVMYFAES